MHLTKEEQMLLEHDKDLIQMSYQRNIPLFGQFNSMMELELGCQALDAFYGKNWLEGVHAVFWGGYPDAERKIICFLPGNKEKEAEELPFPISCIQISPANHKFCDELTHRDYLGALMNLGMTRDQIGDILVKQDIRKGITASTAFVFCKSDKRELVCGLTRIKHTTVTTQEISFHEMGIEPSYQEIVGNISSFRVDAILSLAIKTSRSQSLVLIQSGSVFLNGRCCTENAKKLAEGDVFSVRGYGKFRFDQIGSVSKKGRYRVVIKKYK